MTIVGDLTRYWPPAFREATAPLPPALAAHVREAFHRLTLSPTNATYLQDIRAALGRAALHLRSRTPLADAERMIDCLRHEVTRDLTERLLLRLVDRPTL